MRLWNCICSRIRCAKCNIPMITRRETHARVTSLSDPQCEKLSLSLSLSLSLFTSHTPILSHSWPSYPNNSILQSPSTSFRSHTPFMPWIIYEHLKMCVQTRVCQLPNTRCEIQWGVRNAERWLLREMLEDGNGKSLAQRLDLYPSPLSGIIISIFLTSVSTSNLMNFAIAKALYKYFDRYSHFVIILS